MPTSRLQLLQDMPIFGGIREDTLKLVLELAPRVSVSQGNFFFREHDTADSMFVLEEGRVAVIKTWQGGDYLLKYLQKGDCFGEMALMDFCPRSATVLAVADCSAIEISTSTLFEIYNQDLEQFVMIQMNMGREVSRRLREADERLFQAKVEAKLIEGDFVFHSI